MINHPFQWEWLSWWQNVPAYARNSKGPQWFACICALTIYGFAGLAVVHLSNPAFCICRQVISTLRLEHRWISPKTICLFSNSNHLHLQTCDISTCVRDGTMVVFFTAHQLEFIRPTHFHPALPTEWWMVMDRNIWWWMVMDEGMNHRWMSPKKKLYFPTQAKHFASTSFFLIAPVVEPSPALSAVAARGPSTSFLHLFFPPLPGIALLSSSQIETLNLHHCPGCLKLLACSTAWGK